MQRLLMALTFFSPALLLAQSPFDGTWKTLFDQSQLSPKPIAFSVRNGMYDSFTTVPRIHVKADGKDQPVNGHAYDTIAVTELGPRTVRIVYKKNAATIRELTYNVSADGKTLSYKTESRVPGSDQVSDIETIMERVGQAPAGANATSGSWRAQTRTANDNELLTTYLRNGDEMTYSKPTGETWSAKLDGKDYPVKGSYVVDSVSLKFIDDHHIQATYKLGGQVVAIDSLAASPDGKTMTTVEVRKQSGRVSTYLSERR